MSRTCPQCATTFEDSVFFCGHDGTIVIEDQDPTDFDARLGQQLGAYIVAARVADGAMGRVYEGRHPQTKARVAVKVLHDNVAKDNVAVSRFKREYEAAEEFDHPNIVKVLEFGETVDNSYFMTMEFLEGAELTSEIQKGSFSPARTLHVVSQIAAGLDHAHSFGVIHRDLKPDNIYLVSSDEGDIVKILDFGSVKLQMETGPKLTAFGTTLGSPYYMSPEQAMGKLDVDQRTDVFAIAAILFEMATTKVAFEGQNVAQILMKIVNEMPPPPSASNALYTTAFDNVVMQGLQKDKLQRFSSLGKLADAVAKCMGVSTPSAAIATMTAAEVLALVDNASVAPGHDGSGHHAPGHHAPGHHASGHHASGHHASGHHASGHHASAPVGPSPRSKNEMAVTQKGLRGPIPSNPPPAKAKPRYALIAVGVAGVFAILAVFAALVFFLR